MDSKSKSNRKLLAMVEPPKPIDEMTDEEIDDFAASLVQQVKDKLDQ